MARVGMLSRRHEVLADMDWSNLGGRYVRREGDDYYLGARIGGSRRIEMKLEAVTGSGSDAPYDGAVHMIRGLYEIIESHVTRIAPVVPREVLRLGNWSPSTSGDGTSWQKSTEKGAKIKWTAPSETTDISVIFALHSMGGGIAVASIDNDINAFDGMDTFQTYVDAGDFTAEDVTNAGYKVTDKCLKCHASSTATRVVRAKNLEPTADHVVRVEHTGLTRKNGTGNKGRIQVVGFMTDTGAGEVEPVPSIAWGSSESAWEIASAYEPATGGGRKIIGTYHGGEREDSLVVRDPLGRPVELEAGGRVDGDCSIELKGIIKHPEEKHDASCEFTRKYSLSDQGIRLDVSIKWLHPGVVHTSYCMMPLDGANTPVGFRYAGTDRGVALIPFTDGLREDYVADPFGWNAWITDGVHRAASVTTFPGWRQANGGVTVQGRNTTGGSSLVKVYEHRHARDGQDAERVELGIVHQYSCVYSFRYFPSGLPQRLTGPRPERVKTVGGVSIAQGEFGSTPDKQPGVYNTDWKYPDLKYLEKAYQSGIRLVRLPFTWERVVEGRNKGLDDANVGRLLALLDNARIAGVQVLLSMHNMGRFREAPDKTYTLGTDDLSYEWWASTWKALAARLSQHPAVWGYGIMNEPHDLPVGGDAGLGRTYRSLRGNHDWSNIVWGGKANVAFTGHGSLTRATVDITEGDSVIVVLRPPGTGKDEPLEAPVGTITRLVSGPEGQVTAKAWVQNSTTWSHDNGKDIPLDKVGKFVWVGDDFGKKQDARYVEVSITAPAGSQVVVDLGDQVYFEGATPKDMWEKASRQCAEAIWSADPDAHVVVAGYDWSSAGRWPHERPWVTPLTGTSGCVTYEAHAYFDEDSSGTYKKPYAEADAAAKAAGYRNLPDRVEKELGSWLTWGATNHVDLVLGETGWPKDDDDWKALGEKIFQVMGDHLVILWSSGEWWSDEYALGVLDPGGKLTSTGRQLRDRLRARM